MRDIKNNEELTTKELKSVLLPMMDSIDKFCREHSIRYFILGGTLLGAVRHKGYIPWDDDIDIGMMREDYNLFCDTYVDESKPNYKLLSLDNDKDYYLPFAKVIDSNISFYEDIYKAPEIGAYIDVFPLDYVDKTSKEYARYYANKIWTRIENYRYMKAYKNCSFRLRLYIIISRIVCPFSLHSIAIKKAKRGLKVACSEKTPWISNLHGAWGEKEVVDSICFKDTRDYSFEGRSLMGTTEYDIYLSNLYGDYLELPPPEKRITHHNYTAKWKQMKY